MAEIRYALIGDVHTSFSKDRRRILRRGDKSAGKRGATVVQPHTVQLVPPGSGSSGWQQADVYAVQLSPDLLERWTKQQEKFWVVALSEQAVVSYVQKRFGALAARVKGLASYALTLANRRISTRPSSAGAIGERAKKIGDEWIDVGVVGNDENYTVRVRDSLSYALEAVKGGAGGVENALRSAANRINGMIRHKIGADLEKSWRTPFPEVKRK